MTVIFAEMPDMGHVGYLFPLIRKLLRDGCKVEFWSSKLVANWLPEGVTLREIHRRQNGGAVFCMGFAQAPTFKESCEVAKKSALEGSIEVPQDYDFDWTSIDEADKIAFKRRLLEPDVDLVVDDMVHVLNWVGPFCKRHGIPSVRFSPTIIWPVMIKEGLVPLFSEACAAFASLKRDGHSGQSVASAEDEWIPGRLKGDGSSGQSAASAEEGEPEWVPVRDSAPQHRLYTITPDFLGTHGLAIDDSHLFRDPSAEGDESQILGPVYDPDEDFKWEAFKESGLEAWCDEAPFVFMSLGSMVSQCVQTSASLQADLQKLLDALANRRVLVNFSLSGYPERGSLKMAGWVPQKAILAHGNLQCFISHCGQGGLSEALYAGVPLVAYPFFHDQLLLAESVERLGCGVWLQRFDHGPGTAVADAEDAIERAIAAKSRAQELGAKARDMNGFDAAYAKFQELIKWSHENPRQ